jgi:hypothetical protein
MVRNVDKTVYNLMKAKKHYFSKIMIGLPLSSSGLGYLPFTEKTGIRIPLGVIFY